MRTSNVQHAIVWSLFFAVSFPFRAGGSCCGSGTSIPPAGRGNGASTTRRTAITVPDRLVAVSGMTCADCEPRVQRTIARPQGSDPAARSPHRS